jgi:hypothetical protein
VPELPISGVSLITLRRLTMTAALALYDDLIAFDDAFIESTVERLDDEPLVSLLLLRFRSFLSLGYDESEALLLAVGYAEADVAFLLVATKCTPRVLH